MYTSYAIYAFIYILIEKYQMSYILLPPNFRDLPSFPRRFVLAPHPGTQWYSSPPVTAYTYESWAGSKMAVFY